MLTNDDLVAQVESERTRGEELKAAREALERSRTEYVCAGGKLEDHPGTLNDISPSRGGTR